MCAKGFVRDFFFYIKGGGVGGGGGGGVWVISNAKLLQRDFFLFSHFCQREKNQMEFFRGVKSDF